jgi:hypothetical protein
MITNTKRTPNLRLPLAFVAACGALVLASCSSGDEPAGSGTGGASASTGGAPGRGGATASGGSSGLAGNNVGSGGASGSAGATANGGASSPGTGGSGGMGGAAGRGNGGTTAGTGGSSTGGTSAMGGGGEAGRSGSGGGPGGGTAGGGGHGGAAGASSCAGHAVSFNANVAGNNDPAMARVSVPASADLPTGNANRTVEFWAYLPTSTWAADANTMFFYGTNNRNNDGFGLDFGTTSGGIGTIDPFTNGSTDPMGDNKSSGLMANTAQWAHFAVTWDGTTLRAFVNAVEKVAVPIAMLHTGMTALTIGGYPPAFFNGQIDELRIWSVARTATQIAATMHKTLAGDEASLTGYWKFDETSGTTAADAVTTAGHTAHAGTLAANSTANNPTFVVSTAPISCP